jgi:hypothetical protein
MNTVYPDFSLDLFQYWTASYLLLSGQNPYAHTDVYTFQLLHSHQYSPELLPVLLWNPPSVFFFIIFFSNLSYGSLKIVWSFLTIIIYVVTLSKIGKALYPFYEFSFKKRVAVYSMGGFFYPFVLALYYGQITILFYCFFTLFTLSFLTRTKSKETLSTIINQNILDKPATLATMIKNEKDSEQLKKSYFHDSYTAGIFLGATLIKPHLLFLLYGYLFAWSVTTKKYKTLSGFFGIGIILASFPVFFRRTIWSDWYASITSNPPFFWKTPTLGSWLQQIFLDHYHNISFYKSENIALDQAVPILRTFPSAAALIALLFLMTIIQFLSKKDNNKTYIDAEVNKNRWSQRLFNEKIFCLTVCCSLLFSPYGWAYDQLILLPCLFVMIFGDQQGSEQTNALNITNFKPLFFLTIILVMLFYLSYIFLPYDWGQEYCIISLLVFLGIVFSTMLCSERRII